MAGANSARVSSPCTPRLLASRFARRAPSPDGGGAHLHREWNPSAAAAVLRCKDRLVQEGDSQYEVKSVCGAPDDVQQHTESRRVQRAVERPCAHGNGSCVVVVDHYVEVVVDEWVYDFGRNRFIQYLTFEGGQLVAVRSGSHLEKVHEAVRVGRAKSISAYIGRAIERQAREDSLREIVRDLVAEHGEPSAKDKEWAKRVLRRRKA